MTALADKRAVRIQKFSTFEPAATASKTYFQGAVVGFDMSTGLVDLATVSLDFVPIGVVAESKTLGGGGGTIKVNLFREVWAIWMVNATAGDAVAATDIGGLCYALDDQTVAVNDATNTRSVFGRIWGFSSTKGVLTEPVHPADRRDTSALDE